MLPVTAIYDVRQFCLQLQQNIIIALEEFEPHIKFHHDHWTHPLGGGGSSAILTGGHVFEKAGVNFSHIHGTQLPPAALAQCHDLQDCAFQAMGISVVVHPNNPYVPTTHANLRFFVTDEAPQPNEHSQSAQSKHFDTSIEPPQPRRLHNEKLWWFGGGFDLTPYYGFTEDCQHWHHMAAQACQPFGDDLYPRFKTWCDDYFYLKHRREARGIGGLFFDHYNTPGFDPCFEFLRAVGEHFIKAYIPIVQRRYQLPFGEREKSFQNYRRGRYAEFNLIYDRGTLFGLQSNGRTESILMSLPPTVNWIYDWHPEAGSAEAELYSRFLPRQDWISLE